MKTRNFIIFWVTTVSIFIYLSTIPKINPHHEILVIFAIFNTVVCFLIYRKGRSKKENEK